MFKSIGILVCLYTLYAAVSGQVFAKSGVWGRTILREESPVYFWIVVIIYACLGVVLIAFC